MSKGTSTGKRNVIVDYKNITPEILELFTERYPYGYEDEDIIKFKNSKGEMVRAVPFETSDTKYLVKVSVQMDAKIDAFLNDEDDDTEEVVDETLRAANADDIEAEEEDED